MAVFLLFVPYTLFILLFSLCWDPPLLPSGQSWRCGRDVEKVAFVQKRMLCKFRHWGTIDVPPSAEGCVLHSVGWLPTRDTVGLEKLLSAGYETGPTNLFQFSHSAQETGWKKTAFRRQGDLEILCRLTEQELWAGSSHGCHCLSLTVSAPLFVQWEIFSPLCFFKFLFFNGDL